jgi:HSP20 family protein
MASVVRWTPFDEVVSLREAMDRLFEDSSVRPSRSNGGNGGATMDRLPIDLYETENELVLKARLPGVSPEDVDITIQESELTIKAELKSDALQDEAKHWTWYRHELYHGTVGRRINLPTLVQADKVEATFHNGELRLVLPKAEEVKPRSIQIKTAQ